MTSSDMCQPDAETYSQMTIEMDVFVSTVLDELNTDSVNINFLTDSPSEEEWGLSGIS